MSDQRSDSTFVEEEKDNDVYTPVLISINHLTVEQLKAICFHYCIVNNAPAKHIINFLPFKKKELINHVKEILELTEINKEELRYYSAEWNQKKHSAADTITALLPKEDIEEKVEEEEATIEPSPNQAIVVASYSLSSSSSSSIRELGDYPNTIRALMALQPSDINVNWFVGNENKKREYLRLTNPEAKRERRLEQYRKSRLKRRLISKVLKNKYQKIKEETEALLESCEATRSNIEFQHQQQNDIIQQCLSELPSLITNQIEATTMDYRNMTIKQKDLLIASLQSGLKSYKKELLAAGEEDRELLELESNQEEEEEEEQEEGDPEGAIEDSFGAVGCDNEDVNVEEEEQKDEEYLRRTTTRRRITT